MTNADYYQELNTHDWFHFYSDDSRVYRSGHANLVRLENLAKTDPVKQALFDGFKAHHFSGPAFNKPKAPKPEAPRS